MKTIRGLSGFSVYMAAAGAALGAVAGLAGWAFGIGGAFVATVVGALLFGFFGRAVASAGSKGAPRPAGPARVEEPPKEVPPDRIDQLTGLANSNGLAAWFAEKARRLEEDGKDIFVLLADLDKVDEIERTRGRATAEAVIKEVAKRVSGFTGDDGIAARTGNDKFVAVAAVVPGKAREAAEESAGKLAETICRPVDFGGGTIWIGGAVGAAVGSPREGDATLERAKKALAVARGLGLGRFWVDEGAQKG